MWKAAGTVLILSGALTACGAADWSALREAGGLYTTYLRVLSRARAGEAESQNLAGFMLFFGEGVPRDRAEAHRWFHAAADQGSARAQRNLAIMHYLGAGVPRDLTEAERYFSLAREAPPGPDGRALPFMDHPSIGEAVEQAGGRMKHEKRPGEIVYVTFCAGCHGLNGIAAYIHSPSFAIGDRLDRSDAALLRSVMQGIGEMPGWGNKLPARDLDDVVRFVRAFPEQYELGVLQELRPPPPFYFLFGPMRRDPSAYQTQDEDDIERALRRQRR